MTAIGYQTTVTAADRFTNSGRLYHVTLASNDQNDGFTLLVDSANKPRLFVGRNSTTRGSVISSVGLTVGSVHHVVGTYDGTTVRIHVDGVQRGSTAYSGGIGYVTGRDLLLGSQRKSASRAARFLQGTLDEVALYSTALPATTVGTHNTLGR